MLRLVAHQVIGEGIDVLTDGLRGILGPVRSWFVRADDGRYGGGACGYGELFEEVFGLFACMLAFGHDGLNG